MSSFHFRALDSLGTDDSKARIITALQQGHDNSSVFHHLLPAGDAPDLTQASEQLDERVYRPLTCSHFIDQETEAERKQKFFAEVSCNLIHSLEKCL